MPEDGSRLLSHCAAVIGQKSMSMGLGEIMQGPITGILATIIVLAAPGPTNALLAAAGASSGLRRSSPLLMAQILGYLSAIMAARIFLQTVVEIEAVAVTLRLMAAIYLSHVAVKLWSQGFNATRANLAISFQDVFLTTLFNPKAIIFAFGLIPFRTSETVFDLSRFLALTILSGVFWIVLGNQVGLAAPYAVSRISSIALGVFAGSIAISAIM